MEHVDYVYTIGMADGEITRRLTESVAGVLSLADDGESYAIPVSHHYDGERLLLRLTDDGTSAKMRFVDATDSATFTVWEVSGPGDAWSIIARGALEPYLELDDASLNELFEPVHVFDETIEDIEIHTYRMLIDSITGRETE